MVQSGFDLDVSFEIKNLVTLNPSFVCLLDVPAWVGPQYSFCDDAPPVTRRKSNPNFTHCISITEMSNEIVWETNMYVRPRRHDVTP